MKKQNIKTLKKYFAREISLARENEFSSILLPFDLEYEAYPLDSLVDIEELYNIGNDLGWDRFCYINFDSKHESIIDFYELEVA
jgi:hypothetical protein